MKYVQRWTLGEPVRLHSFDDLAYIVIRTDSSDPALQREVALVGAWDLEGERYAYLIAAAPKLLAACQAVVERWKHGDLAEAARMCADAVRAATGRPSLEAYRHRYPTTCPNCNADLKADNAVTIHFIVAGQPGEVASRLDPQGWLADIDSVIAHGHHSGTDCRSCGSGIDQYEILDEADAPCDIDPPLSRMSDADTAANDDLLAKAEAAGLTAEDLDETVHELANSIAADVNNEGMEGQLRYLIAEWGGEAVAREIDRRAEERSQTTH